MTVVDLRLTTDLVRQMRRLETSVKRLLGVKRG